MKKRKKKTISKSLPIVSSHIKYKYPYLQIFFNSTNIWRFFLSIFSAAIICSILYYAIFVKDFTPNGVFDAILATPIQVLLILLGASVIVSLRVLGYKGTLGVERKYIASDHNCKYNINGYIYIPLYKYKDISIDARDILSLTSIHPFVEAMLRFTVIEKEELYRLEAGSLDIPKATLKSVKIIDGCVIIYLGCSSFYNIFFTHYFPDYHPSSQSFDENTDHPSITLRSVIGHKCMEICHGSAIWSQIVVGVMAPLT